VNRSRHVLLVTGATGAIGAPLTEALTDDDSVEHVYALTHAATTMPLVHPRLTALRGDVTGDALGLDPRDASTLQSRVTGIIHAAADTRFGTTLDVARATNVGGIRGVLAFAEGCRTLDRVLVLSTTHVAGRRTGRILESELAHEAGFVNAYEQSKFEAEHEARDRMSSLPVAVCRLSSVVGHATTGAIGRRGAIHHAVLLMYAGLAPMVPGREENPVDLLALDYAVAAVSFLLTRGFERGATWHLSAGDDTIPAGELLDLTVEAIARHRPRWRRRTIERPAFADLDTFELFRRSVEQAGDAALRASTDVVAQFAPQLAFPKCFDDRACQAALAPAGVRRPRIRDVWPRVVSLLVSHVPGPTVADDPATFPHRDPERMMATRPAEPGKEIL
jgi:nucleoside-diphosphate-sugar epimerase